MADEPRDDIFTHLQSIATGSTELRARIAAIEQRLRRIENEFESVRQEARALREFDDTFRARADEWMALDQAEASPGVSPFEAAAQHHRRYLESMLENVRWYDWLSGRSDVRPSDERWSRRR